MGGSDEKDKFLSSEKSGKFISSVKKRENDTRLEKNTFGMPLINK